MKKQKPIPAVSTYEVERKVRRDWGEISPVTRVEISRKYRKQKHPKYENEKLLKECDLL